MKIKIAVIGSADFCERTRQLTSSRVDIELNSYVYEEPQQAPDLIRSLTPCDVLFFSGSLPYLYAKDALENVPIPSVHLKQDETEIAVTLLHLALQRSLDLKRISIDVRSKQNIESVLKDLNCTTESPFVHILQDNEPIQAIIAFHKQLALQQKTDIAITSVHAVHEQLQQQNIPAMKMIDPESSILRTIELAKQQAILHKSNSAQIAVGIVKNSDCSLDTASAIEKMSSILQAHWEEQNRTFTLFTTMGNVEQALKRNDFLSGYQQLFGKAKLAFGYGETIIEATENAQFALDFIQQNDDHSFYVLDSDKKMHGPFPKTGVAIEMKVNDPALVAMAEKTKLSPANVSKLLSFSHSRQTKQFTAHDLALYLNVSRRTAERTLKKLVEFNYAKIIGEEMAYKQGRPRSLYELNLPTYL